MISVIIPTYNRAKYLERAVYSVLQQTLPCAELLVIDDGSTDETAAIIKTIKKMAGRSEVEIRYIFQENQGAASARNRGIAEASHDMLCFLDSDDWWKKEKIAEQWAAMNRQPHYLISHTGEIWYRHGKRVNQKQKHAPGQGEIFQRCLGMCVVGMSTVMVRRQLFDQYGVFNPDLLCCEDYDLWLRVSRQEHFLLVDKPLISKEGGRADQLSRIHRLGMDTWRIRSICSLLDTCTLLPTQARLAVCELEKKCAIYGKGCIKHGRSDEGEQYLALARQYRARYSSVNS